MKKNGELSACINLIIARYYDNIGSQETSFSNVIIITIFFFVKAPFWHT